MNSKSLEHSFSALALLTLEPAHSSLGSHSVHCGVWNSILGLHILDASITTPLKNVSDLAKYTLCGRVLTSCSGLRPNPPFCSYTHVAGVLAQSMLCLTLATPWTVARQAPLSMGFSRQKYWNGSPFLSPGDLPNPGIKHTSPASSALAGRFFTTVPPGKLTLP